MPSICHQTTLPYFWVYRRFIRARIRRMIEYGVRKMHPSPLKEVRDGRPVGVPEKLGYLLKTRCRSAKISFQTNGVLSQLCKFCSPRQTVTPKVGAGERRGLSQHVFPEPSQLQQHYKAGAKSKAFLMINLRLSLFKGKTKLRAPAT